MKIEICKFYFFFKCIKHNEKFIKLHIMLKLIHNECSFSRNMPILFLKCIKNNEIVHYTT